eukprot:NODE_1926_length_694_cov_114.791887_g1876_i0.p1 GENE.NODE_1926_length_694_cov_114.791887_g1876_i0~~NODE_1926_length_694_cov_114.791887_g1876_i0.p1  ORF type:complete len:156 (+),score=43.32 NODE_1926_length_694_cov_114.791887_g1876_i0:78-545(+)
MALSMQPENFEHMLRIQNTNIDGKRPIGYAMTSIKGCGRRFSNLMCKKAGIDPTRRAGTLSEEEQKQLVSVMTDPTSYKIPEFFLNRKKDPKDGKTLQCISNTWDAKIRDDLEKMKKCKLHRGLRHYWGLRVRGQHTKTTGRRGRTVGVSKKKGG